jgi:lipopolysaccharide transport system permease protein
LFSHEISLPGCFAAWVLNGKCACPESEFAEIIVNGRNKLSRYAELTFVLTKKEIKVRYKSYLLGYIWSIANPLAFALVFYFVFQVIMKIQVENYVLFLICGLFPWQWFSNSVNASPGTFLGNASLIKKIKFPRSSVVLAVVLQDAAHFALSLPVVAIFLLAYGGSPTLAWLWGIPILMSVQLLLTFGSALFLASVNLFFRDMERLVAVIMVFVFYFTPVLYSDKMIPHKYLGLLALHPVAPLIISWRSLLLEGVVNISYVKISFVHATVIFFVGYLVYRKLSWRFAEVL